MFISDVCVVDCCLRLSYTGSLTVHLICVCVFVCVVLFVAVVVVCALLLRVVVC